MTDSRDFEVLNQGGNIAVLVPLTGEAKTWVASNIPDDAQRWAGGVVVEQRYLFDILEGIINYGLVVR